jgi:hypothetical protein
MKTAASTSSRCADVCPRPDESDVADLPAAVCDTHALLFQAGVFVADETRINRDSFDALICAAAIDLELPLITRDADSGGAGVVKVIW